MFYKLKTAFLRVFQIPEQMPHFRSGKKRFYFYTPEKGTLFPLNSFSLRE